MLSKIKGKIQNRLTPLQEHLTHPRWLPILQIAKRTANLHINTLSAGISFYFITALFPLVLFLVSLTSLIGNFMGVRDILLQYLSTMIPEGIYQSLEAVLQDFLSEQRSIPILSVSSITILWAASKGFSVLFQSIRLVYETSHNQKRPIFILWRALALLFTFLLSLSLLLVLLLLSFGGIIIEQIETWTSTSISEGFSLGVRMLLAFAYLFLVFLFIYRSASPSPSPFRQGIPGAIFSAGAWIALSSGFSIYVSNIGRYSIIYGSLAGFVLLMFWIYFCVYAILLGGILNKELLLWRQRKPQPSAEPESTD